MLDVFRWWLIMQVIGWVALPLAMRLFRWLPDRGYTAAKALGLLFSSYFLWLGASIHILPNSLGGGLVALLLLALLSAWSLWKPDNHQESVQAFLRRQSRMVLTSELLFTAALLLWAGLRAFAPDKIMNAGGEKFMEIAFLNGILNSSTFPPLDPWLSGFAISYYYFGYVMMAFLTRLSGVLPGVGFDLYDALLFALTGLGAFGVVYNLVALAQHRLGKSEKAGISFGLLGTLLVTLMANLEGVLEVLHSLGRLPPKLLTWFDIPDLANAPITGAFNPGLTSGWWWWRGSRVLQDYNLQGEALGVSPITEFPFFSFLLGDNHPHVLALPFVLLAIAFALNLLNRQIEQKNQDEHGSANWWNPIAYSLAGDGYLFAFGAILFGSLAFLNTWDFPIYLGLVMLAFVAGRFARHNSLTRNDLQQAFVLAVSWLVSAILCYIFFYFSFSSQAGGILPYLYPPTRLVQYLVMYGPFIFILSGFLVLYQVVHGLSWKAVLQWWMRTAGIGAILLSLILLSLVISGLLKLDNPELRTAQEALRAGGWIEVAGQVFIDRLSEPWLFLVVSGLIGLALASLFAILPQPGKSNTPIFSSDFFIFLLIFTGLALSWTTEFFYLRDNFGVRMNTIFKFYYQTWVMFALASAYAMWWIYNVASKQRSLYANLVLSGAILLILGGLVYPALATNSRVAGLRGKPNLDGTSSLRLSNPEDWAAIDWLVQNADRSQGAPIILEAPGESYNYEGRISAFTGFPAVLGWALHEGQWRGSNVEQDQRRPDILAIYTNNDPRLTLELLRKWQVKYVILGTSERIYIQRQCQSGGTRCNLTTTLRKFDAALELVFSQGETKVYAVP